MRDFWESRPLISCWRKKDIPALIGEILRYGNILIFLPVFLHSSPYLFSQYHRKILILLPVVSVLRCFWVGSQWYRANHGASL